MGWISFFIDEALDERADREARRRQISKAALIRQCLLAQLGPDADRDPVDELIGISDAEPADGVDAVLYEA